MEKQKNLYIAIAYLVLTYLTVWMGLALPRWEMLFRQIVPWHLLITFIVVLSFQRKYNFSFVRFCILVFSLGFLIEWIGTDTGLIFGSYTYGETLGLKLNGVPVLTGLNWLLLTYSSGILITKLMKKTSRLVKAFSGAALMLITDLFMEPAAARFGYWNWENAAIPLQNFLAGYVISFIFMLIFFYSDFWKKNPVAIVFYIVQLLFFMALSFT